MAQRTDELIEHLGMEYLPGEGIWVRVIWRNDFGNAIYALLTREHFSALHRLKEDELWVHLDGAPVHMTLLHPDGSVTRPVIGAIDSRHALVPAGTWQGARPDGEWSLVLCSLAPAFTGFELATRDDDWEPWQGARDEIEGLIRG
jgi:predicted cupin superfamily sugar epimerase